MGGFFASSVITSDNPLQSRLPKCGACGLYKHCTTPKMAVAGKGRKQILVIGEFPSSSDDEQGRHMTGEGGDYLRKALLKHGVNLFEDCWVTNAIICSPKRKTAPTSKEIDYCRPNIIKVINELQPQVILLLGDAAIQSVIGWVWKEGAGGAARWEGTCIPCQQLNAWLCPLLSPSHLARLGDPVLGLLFGNALQKAAEQEARPWSVVPNYEADVDLVYSPDEAATIIRKMIRRGGMVAFDYECNRLKPDSKTARIVSCSVCWRGKKTIAYPWAGEAIEATGELLRSPLPKVASNLKFEERWTRRFFKHGVCNWYWDTMLAAHVIDNRRGITSIKFQSFVTLGTASYDDHIKPLLQSTKDNHINRIHEIELKELLLYNGLDSLLEYKVAVEQMKRLEYPLPEGTT